MSKPHFVKFRTPNPDTSQPYPGARPVLPADAFPPVPGDGGKAYVVGADGKSPAQRFGEYRHALVVWESYKDAWRHGYYWHENAADYTKDEIAHNLSYVTHGGKGKAFFPINPT